MTNPTPRRLFPALALPLALAALAAPLAAQGEPAAGAPPELTMLRLYDGSILWGSIVAHDSQALHFVRLDNGGKVHLPWGRLDAGLAESLLEHYGYIDHSGDEVMIEADRLVLTDGTDIVGLIINRSPTELWIKTATRTFPVPMLKLRGAATRLQAPALDVFTRDELYQQEVAKLDPTSAQSLWDMAVYCERIYDFARAVEHLQALALLDKDFKPSEVATAIERDTRKVKDQVQLDAMRAIDVARIRGKFDEAKKLIDGFLASYETSPYRADVAKKRTQVEKAREQKLREKTVELWYLWTGRLLQAKSREPGLSLDAAIGYADEALSKDIVDRVTKELQATVSAEATPDAAAKYWAERSGGKWRQASYGQGTFLLGDAEARKGLVKEEKKDPAQLSEADNERKKLQDRIDRYLQSQEMSRKSKVASKDEEDALARFWSEYLASSKAQWMLAHYVEHSGGFELDDPQFTNCPDCGGSGTREILNAVGRQNSGGSGGANQAPRGSNTQLVDCPTCHRIGVFRRVRYR